MHIYILLILAVLLILCVIKNKKKIFEGAISETVIPPSEMVNTKTPANFPGWNPSRKLGKCEGDCDRNSDCTPGLICMGDESYLGGSSNRQKYFKGQCTGNMKASSADYCLDPNGPTEGFNNMKEGFGSIKEGLTNSYYITGKGSTCGTVNNVIRSKAECATALTAVGKSNRFVWNGISNAIPGGCSVRGQDHGHYDKRGINGTVGKGRSDLAAVCVRRLLDNCGSDCMGKDNNCSGALKCLPYVLNQPIPGCKAGTTTNQQFVVGKGYCYDAVQATQDKSNADATKRILSTQQAIVNTETANIGFTGTMKKRFFGLKNSIIEGAGNTSLFDDSEVTTKLDNIKNLLDANKTALENVNQLGGQTFTSTQIQNNDWYPEALNLYKPIFDSIFPATSAARNLNLLASIIGFNMDNEDKLIEYLSKIYGKFNTYAPNDDWATEARKLELYILALKILKWKISNDYIEYFKKADQKINAPSTNFTNFSLSAIPGIKSAIDTDPMPGVTSGAATIPFQPILNEVNLKVGEKLMKKLNELLNIPSTGNDPKLDLSNYVMDKINTLSGNRLADCKKNCLEKQKNNFNCTGCGGNNKYFENEINFILHPPLKAADMAKLIEKYIFIYNKSKTGVDIRYYNKDIINGGTDTNLLNFPYSGAYIKLSSSTTTNNLYPSSNPIIYWKGAGKSPLDYDKELTGVYYRPRYPLWGFTDIDVPIVQTSTQPVGGSLRPKFTPSMPPPATLGQLGFTNMGNLMKSNSLVQTFNNITQNRINDVFSFFKNNAFKTGIIEGNVVFDQLQPITNFKIYLNNTYLPHDDASATQIEKINVKDNANKTHIWYKYVFTRQATGISDRTSDDTQFLDEILEIIKNDYQKIFDSSALKIGAVMGDKQRVKNTPSYASTTHVKGDKGPDTGTTDNLMVFNIDPEANDDSTLIDDAWNKAIINLYVNDEGNSFITTETEYSCKDNICPNGQSQTNGQDESGLIKKVIQDINIIKTSSYLKNYMYFIHNTSGDAAFSVDSTNSDQIICNGCEYPMIQNGRSLLITKKGMFRVEFGDTTCPADFKQDSTTIQKRQQCEGLEYGTNCRLNYVTANTGMEEIPRCYELDGETINSELAAFKKTCESIPGMKEDPNEQSKCITNNDYTYTPDGGGSAYKLTDEHLRTCYLYKDGVSNTCDPKKSKTKNGDCLCLFENEYDSENPKNVIGMKGKAIVEDSYCQAIDDTDLTFSECAEYAKWTTNNVHSIENEYFNKENNNQDMGYRMGCQGDLAADGSMTKFNFVNPSKRYGKRTHVRKWGDDELNTLSKLKSETQSVCKTDYTEKQRLNVAKNIDTAETVLTEHVVIPGMPEKSLKTGNYLITKTSSQQRDYAKDNCNSQKSWDSCYMSGSTEFLNKGDEMVEDAGYSEFKLYKPKGESTGGDSTEGFMGFRKTLREGATGSSSSTAASGAASGCLKNCAPMRFSNGNCAEDITTTKDVNGIQRFFKMCPQECLTPLDSRYEDIDQSGGVNDDGTRIAYDAATHGCRTSKQCEDTCDKTEIQIKHIYDNRCKEGENCTLSELKSQYEAAIIGKINYNNTIKITQVEINNDLITKYSPKQGLDVTVYEGNEQREKAILNFIEELKKNPTGRSSGAIKPQIIGMSYQMNTNSNDILHIIYKKANVFAKLEYDSAQTEWRTYIHRRTWKDYWYDPNKPSIQSLTRNLTEEEMQRMQGVDIGISMDAFDKIPLYWQNDKTKEANFDDICDWIDNKIKAGVLKDKDSCTDTFKNSWSSRTLGIGKTPTKGLNFDEYEQVYNLRQTAEEGSPYTDMTNNMDIGKKDLSLDDFYKRNLLKNKVENRLGGSDNAYTKTYKPLNPEARPKFFNSAWGLFH